MVGLKSMDFASKLRVDFIMGIRCKLDGLEVTVELGDRLPSYEFYALREIIKKVALRVKREMEEEEKSKMPIVKAD